MPGSIVDRGFRKGIAGLFTGAAAVFWGLKRITRDNELRGLAIIPLGLTTLIYGALLVAIVLITPRILDWTRPDDPASWQVYLSWFLAVLVIVGVLAVSAVLFTAIVELVGGPFYDKMAVKMLEEKQIAWTDPGFVAGAIPDLFRSLILAVPALVCWLLGLIPVIGIFFWALGILIACFGLGASAINPALQMTSHKPVQRTRWFLKYLATTIGIGAVVALSMLVPLLGLISIPSAVVGATRLYLVTDDRSPL